MARGLGSAILVSALLLLALGWTGALANGGVFAGRELIALAIIGLCSASVFYFIGRRTVSSQAKIIVVALAIWLALPLFLILLPTVFCILFLPNASCI